MNSDSLPSSLSRILVTRSLVGTVWHSALTSAGLRVDISGANRPLTAEELIAAIGEECHGAIGQLAEPWNAKVLQAFKAAGGRVYANYAVGYNNVDIAEATRLGIAIGNTPGVLTEATAELAAALTYAAARRITEADPFVRSGRFTGWEPEMLLGRLLHRKTLGVFGAGRIGSAYIRTMALGNRMNVLYLSRSRKPALERELDEFNNYLMHIGEDPIQCRFAESLDELLRESDVLALLSSFDPSLRHLLTAEKFAMMRSDAILVNASRGPIIDEAALVRHLRQHPDFSAGLDVYEHEPSLAPGLTECPNAVLLPHLGSGTRWSREAMSVIAARNVIGVLKGWPQWSGTSLMPFLGKNPPNAVPSQVN